MTSELLLPHFLGIGAVKAGTTWLHRNLYQHPELYLPVQKPVYFWDRHRERGLETYSRIFAPGRDLLRGEFTASYSVLPDATKDELRELLPDLKLILVLREPRSRDWSEARMELTLIQGRERDSLTEDDYLAFLESDQCRERGDYCSIYRSWTERFPPEQVFVGLYEDIARRPQEFLASVLRFLGVTVPDDFSGYPCAERVFAGPVIDIPARCRELLERRYPPAVLAEMERCFGLPLVDAWKDA